ncbi:hypothetical protein DC894_RS16385 [Vibrio parahaemolyticus]|nr:hypothetical protein [Vibrio parahaemolyticus]EGQ9476653.1 hypothetical protein [Vibrio parahaemolyticus]EJG0185013.1 hypothetical protein [Vibrio parahaemolyticus]EJG0190194.1 hypothetical protein [Vibrio parahaemolyticus]EJG0781425.1 hypothetical protein [Vibrio parahaemolyticus]
MDNEALELNSDTIERQLQCQFDSDKPITKMCYPLSATSLVVPALNKADGMTGMPERHIKMTDTQDANKRVIYQAMVAAYNYALHDETAPNSAKYKYSKNVPNFIHWLNEVKIDNRYKVLKEYEAYRFDTLGNHGGLSALSQLKTVFTYACEHSAELEECLPQNELQYLADLRSTKVSPNLNRSQESIASYFGEHDWLRREDIGVGNELYTALASPKMTVDSFIQTVSSLLLEIDKQKKRLKQFLIDNAIDVTSVEPCLLKKMTFRGRVRTVGDFTYSLLSAFHRNGNEGDKAMMEMVLLSLASTNKAFWELQTALESQETCDALFLSQARSNKGDVSSGRSRFLVGDRSRSVLFSPVVMNQLVSQGASSVITDIESALFTWLMASQTVQPSDIAKLTTNSFRMLSVGDRVTHIECEYFKGRARIVHQTRSLSARTLEGKAVLSFLAQHESGKLATSYDKKNMRISDGKSSLTGFLAHLLQLNSVQHTVKNAHKNKGDLPLIIPNVLVKLIENINDIRTQGADSTSTLTQPNMFGLRAIKNSAVHAFSDPYTLHFLINRNSHNNQTEKQHYLNADNEEWMNSSGRITREVMQDLINNVFDLNFEGLSENESQQTEDAFNAEFTAVTDTISYKTEEMEARLRVVTGQEKGKVNEVGVLSHSSQDVNQGLAPIYVLDSPVTAWRFYNYLHEFKAHYKQLLAVNPDHLFKTVLPTVEWMQSTLKKLSKESREQGVRMHKKMLENGVKVSVFHSI